MHLYSRIPWYSNISMRHLGLFSALVVYGGFSSPMPGSVDWAVIYEGCMLAIYAGIFRSLFLVHIATALKGGWIDIMPALALIYLIMVPLFNALVYQAGVEDIIRDIIPLLFFFMPVFFKQNINNYNIQTYRLLLLIVAGVGVSMAIRFLILAVHDISMLGVEHMGFDGFLVLGAEPAILFAAIYLPLHAHRVVTERGFSIGSIIFLAVMLIGAATCIAAFGAKVARGPIGLVFLAYIIYFTLFASLSKLSSWLVMISVIGVILIKFESIVGILSLIEAKHEAVGSSGKLEEYFTLIRYYGDSVWVALFGMGWGALFEVRDNALFSFTHSIIVYFGFKAGLIGLIFCISYLVTFIPSLMVLKSRAKPEFLAFTFALLYPMLFQPTYKALTVGVMLFCLVVGGHLYKKGALINSNTRR